MTFTRPRVAMQLDQVVKYYASKLSFFLDEPLYSFLDPKSFLFYLPFPVQISVSNLLGFGNLRSIYVPNKSIYLNILYKLLEFYTKGKLYIWIIRNTSVQHFVFYSLHKLVNSRWNIQKLEQNRSSLRVDLIYSNNSIANIIISKTGTVNSSI